MQNKIVSSAGNIQTVYELLRASQFKNQTQNCLAYFVFKLLITFMVKKNVEMSDADLIRHALQISFKYLFFFQKLSVRTKHHCEYLISYSHSQKYPLFGKKHQNGDHTKSFQISLEVRLEV